MLDPSSSTDELCTTTLNVGCSNFLHDKGTDAYVPYSGLFWREKFFANSWHVRSNGNFGGKISVVPLAKRSHAYLTRVRVTRVRVRARSRIFTKNFFADRHKAAKFVKIFSLEKKRYTVYSFNV